MSRRSRHEINMINKTVMCRWVDVLSDNEAEEITPEWAAKGTNVLYHPVVEMAEIIK